MYKCIHYEPTKILGAKWVIFSDPGGVIRSGVARNAWRLLVVHDSPRHITPSHD